MNDCDTRGYLQRERAPYILTRTYFRLRMQIAHISVDYKELNAVNSKT